MSFCEALLQCTEQATFEVTLGLGVPDQHYPQNTENDAWVLRTKCENCECIS